MKSKFIISLISVSLTATLSTTTFATTISGVVTSKTNVNTQLQWEKEKQAKELQELQ